MENLKKLRRESKMSQQKLADHLQLSQQSIYKYENGLAEPDLNTLKKIASFFNTSTDYLIGYSNDPRVIEPYSETALTKGELQHLRYFRLLSPRMREIIDTLIQECL